jgi:hypothetical protein
MKKIIAIAAILASTQTFAFFDEGNNSGSLMSNSNADVVGNATGEGEATFGMTFEGTGSTAGNIRGNGSNNGNFVGRGDDVRDSGSATAYADNGVAGSGNGDAAGSAKFSFNFSGRAKAAGDFTGNGDFNNHGGFNSVTTPYYYGK